MAATLIGVGLVVFALFTFVTVRAITKPGAKVTLGDETFRVGDAAALAARIEADDYPLLFQDLRDKSIDLFVHHERGAPPAQGWRAFEAHAPPRHADASCATTGRVAISAIRARRLAIPRTGKDCVRSR